MADDSTHDNPDADIDPDDDLTQSSLPSRRADVDPAAALGGNEVGYGKPPKEHRFPKGKSGNPSGKRKAQKRSPDSGSLPDALEKELDRKITVTDSGRRRRLTKRDLVAKNLTNSAVKGDLRASRLVAQLTGRKGEDAAPAIDAEAERLKALDDRALHYLGYAVIDVAIKYAAEMMQAGVGDETS